MILDYLRIAALEIFSFKGETGSMDHLFNDDQLICPT